MGGLRKALYLLLVTLGLGVSAQASPERDFVMSCTYGVLAGTLVGTASLAFIEKPGDNLQRVARGASIGLYMGIGLGYYTAYILPKQMQKEEEKRLEEGIEGDQPQSSAPRWMIFPLFADRGWDGVGAIWQIRTF